MLSKLFRIETEASPPAPKEGGLLKVIRIHSIPMTGSLVRISGASRTGTAIAEIVPMFTDVRN